MSTTPASPIRAKDRDAIVQSLRSGVVPRVGQHLIQVGRVREVEAFVKDTDRIVDGGTSFRVVVGEYGAGKTFLLNLVRAIAMQKAVVTMHADLNPDRRFQGSSGEGRSLYAELVKNMATRTKPEGGALAAVVERFVTQARDEGKKSGQEIEDVIKVKLGALTEMVNGYDFADVISAYYRGFESGNDSLKANAIRWLRGEFSTKTEARQALGVRVIVDDDSVYDQIKLLARFVRLAGYAGMMVVVDEAVNLYKLNHSKARDANYEQILRILNDSLQGSSEGLGFIIGATPDTLTDPRRGLYSYAALQSRLSENAFAARAGIVDFSGPVIRLSSLTKEDFFVLLQKLRDVYAYGDSSRALINDAGIIAFMRQAEQRLGETYFRTPRTTITSFLSLLATVEQMEGGSWEKALGLVELKKDTGALEELAGDDANPGNAESVSVGVLSALVAGANKAVVDDDDLSTFKL